MSDPHDSSKAGLPPTRATTKPDPDLEPARRIFAAIDLNHLPEATSLCKTLDKSPDPLHQATSRLALATIARQSGTLVEARKLMPEAAEKIAVLAPGTWLHARANIAIASLSWNLGDLATAENYYHQAQSILPEVQASEPIEARYLEGLVLMGLANIAQWAGDYRLSNERIEQALPILRQDQRAKFFVLGLLNNQATNYARLGDNKAADALQWACLRQRARLNGRKSLAVSSTWMNLGFVAFLDQRYEASVKYTRRALRLRRELCPGSAWHAETATNAAEALIALRRYAEARPYAEEAWAIIQQNARATRDAQERLAFARCHFDIGLTTAQAQALAGDHDAAWITLAQCRALSLVSNPGQEDPLLQKYNTQIASLEAAYRLKQSPKIAKRLARIRLQRDVHYADSAQDPWHTQPQIPTPRPGEAWIAYLVSDSLTLVLARDQHQGQAVLLPIGSDQAESGRPWPRRHSRSISPWRIPKTSAAAWQKWAARTAQDLFPTEIQPLLAKNKSLVVLPDDALWAIPWATIEDPARPGHPLAQNHDLTLLPTPALLAQSRQTTNAKNKTPSPQTTTPALVVAATDPDEQAPQNKATHPEEATRALGQIPAAAQEAAAVAKNYPQATLIVDQPLTPQALKHKAEAARVIHFACHGLLDPKEPWLSSLVLGPKPQHRLYAHTVAAWKLPGSLVVLAACETATGRFIQNEGVLGLTYAFLRAGARTVVSTLWKVADNPARLFSQSFHAHLQNPGATAAQALAHAQKTLQSQNHTPYDWAAFTLVGDPGFQLH